MRSLLITLGSIFALGLTACGTTGDVKPTVADNTSPEYFEQSPANVYINLARAYSRSGQIAFALENAQKAVAADDRNPRAYATLANVYQQSNDLGAAETQFAKARSLSPNDPYVRNLYGLLLCSKGQLAAADQEFMAAAISPRNTTPWRAYASAGICYENSGQLKTARERLRTAYGMQPSSPDTVRALARVERKLGNASAARELEERLR